MEEQTIGKVLHEFSALPKEDLLRTAKSLGIDPRISLSTSGGIGWRREKGETDLLAALYTAEWAYCDERNRREWFFPSPMGLAMLGLAKMPPVSKLPMDLKVLPNNSVFAGAGQEMDGLACLFRYCRIKRIGEVIEHPVGAATFGPGAGQGFSGEELRGR